MADILVFFKLKLCKKSAIKQTAVGWLVDELKKAEYIPKNSAIIDYVINEAKQMEKQQQQGYIKNNLKTNKI